MQIAPWHQKSSEERTFHKGGRINSFGFASAVVATIILLALLITFTPIGVYAKSLINYLLRADSNEIEVTITLPPRDQSIGNKSLRNATLSIAEAEDLAGFDAIVPTLLPENYLFIGANYDSRLGTIELYFEGQTGWFVITQKKGRIDYQRVGASATIELVPIGDVVAEFVPGGWSVLSVNDEINQTAIPGSEVALNAIWDSQLRQNMLRWQNGDILIEILSFSDQLDVEALVSIAKSMNEIP
jgi:hypothetical protein